MPKKAKYPLKELSKLMHRQPTTMPNLKLACETYNKNVEDMGHRLFGRPPVNHNALRRYLQRTETRYTDGEFEKPKKK